MKALKCDACGALYEESDSDKSIKIGKNGREMVVVIKFYASWVRENPKDICDGCIKEAVNKFNKAK